MPAVPSIAFPFKGSDSTTYSGNTVPLDANGAVPTSVADGSSATLGARADAAYALTSGAASTAGSMIALLKGLIVTLAGLLSVDTVVKATATPRGALTTVKATGAAVAAGGSGYAAGDTITVAAGVFTAATVSSGAVTAVTATTPNALTARTSGAQAQTATSGSGTGATLVPAYAAASQQLMPANTSRRGFVIQNQSGSPVWFTGVGSATADYNSLAVAAGDYFATDAHHVGTGAISLIGSDAGQGVYAREF